MAVNKGVYSANDYPNNLWGGLAGYTPGTATGEIAWTKVNDCLLREMKIFSSDFADEDLRPELIIDDGNPVDTKKNMMSRKSFVYRLLNNRGVLEIKSTSSFINRIKIYSLNGKMLVNLDGLESKSIEVNLKEFSGHLLLCIVEIENFENVFKFTL